MIWLLRRFAKSPFGGGVAWDEEDVDDFVKQFPEAKATLRVYTLGPNSSPMLNRAANRALKRGFLTASSVGNMDARSYNQRTWCRYWVLTDAGKAAAHGQAAATATATASAEAEVEAASATIAPSDRA